MLEKLDELFNGDINDKNYVSGLILDENVSFEKHLEKWIELDKAHDKIIPTLYKSKQNLLKWIKSRIDLDNIRGKIESYLTLAQKEETQTKIARYVEKYYAALDKVNKVRVDEANLIFKHKNEILKILNDPDMEKYKRWFNAKYFVEEGHRIDKDEFRAMQEIHGVEFVDRLFFISHYVERNLPLPLDSNGKQAPQVKNYESYFMAPDPAIRKNAWTNWINFQWSKIYSLSEMIKIKIFRMWQEAHFREFKSVFEMNMHDFEIDDEIGQDILETSAKCKDVFKKYALICAAMRLQILNEKEVTPWQKYTPALLKPASGISKAEAKDHIIDALSVLGPEYQNIVKKVFVEKWMDWDHDPDDGETNFSFAFTGNNKYPIKVNFKGEAEQTIILAHEIGHSIASELSKKNGVYVGIHRVLSEVASYVNETLMFLYYVNNIYKTDPDATAYLVNIMLKRLYDTINNYSTIMLINNAVERHLLSKGNLTPQDILTTIRETKNNFGVLLEFEKNWIKSDTILQIYDIPDFMTIYNSFGNHQPILYYLGATVGVCIAIKIFNGDKELAKKYVDFLKAGTTNGPVESLKALGFDVTKADTFKPVAKICESLVAELQKYLNGDTRQSAPAENDEPTPCPKQPTPQKKRDTSSLIDDFFGHKKEKKTSKVDIDKFFK